jgi:hypothetical protein
VHVHGDAEPAQAFALRRRGSGRDDDMGPQAVPTRCPRDGGGEVARGRRDDPGLAGRRERRAVSVGAAPLERAERPQVLPLEPDLVSVAIEAGGALESRPRGSVPMKAKL